MIKRKKTQVVRKSFKLSWHGKSLTPFSQNVKLRTWEIFNTQNIRFRAKNIGNPELVLAKT